METILAYFVARWHLRLATSGCSWHLKVLSYCSPLRRTWKKMARLALARLCLAALAGVERSSVPGCSGATRRHRERRVPFFGSIFAKKQK